jgi:hypothetical protein
LSEPAKAITIYVDADAKLRHRLNAAFVAELRRLGADRFAHRCPRAFQLPANGLDRLLLNKKARRTFAIVSTVSIQNEAPSSHRRLCGPKRQWGPVCTPITPRQRVFIPATLRVGFARFARFAVSGMIKSEVASEASVREAN